MAEIKLSFTAKNCQFCICATCYDTQGKRLRHYRVIKDLISPFGLNWSTSLQRFTNRNNKANHNNRIISETRALYESLLQQHEFKNGQELFAYADKFTNMNDTLDRAASDYEVKQIIGATDMSAIHSVSLNTPIQLQQPVQATSPQNTITIDLSNPNETAMVYQLLQFKTAPVSDSRVAINLDDANMVKLFMCLWQQDKTTTVQQTTIEPSEPIAQPQPTTAKAIVTFREYIASFIDEKENPINKKPSSNYRGYYQMLKRLEGEGKMINMDIAQITKADLKSFSNYLLETKYEYPLNMTRVHTVLRQACRDGLIPFAPTFDFKQYTPTKKKKKTNDELVNSGGDVNSMTKEQYQMFLDYPCKAKHIIFRDCCELLYELKSRPIDIVTLHKDNIVLEQKTGKYVLVYTPTKKKNCDNSKTNSPSQVTQYISPRAMEIIKKYKNCSKGGYLIPIIEDIERKYDFDKKEDFDDFFRKWERASLRLRNFLRSVGKAIHLSFPLTAYVFRRSALTHAVQDNVIPTNLLAKMAGTSVDMLEQHYINHFEVLSDYETKADNAK